MNTVKGLLTVSLGVVSVLSNPCFAEEAARTLGDKLVGCMAITDANERLHCFDTTMKAAVSSSYTQSDRTIFTFDGSGSTKTRPFHVDGPWELQWSGDGMFAIKLDGVPDSANPAHYFSGSRGEAGSAYQSTGGDFTLAVEMTAKPWHIKVVSIPQ